MKPSATFPISPTPSSTHPQALKGETFVNPEDLFHCTRSLPHGHVAAVLATKLKLDSLRPAPGAGTGIDRRSDVARVIEAQSKLGHRPGLSRRDRPLHPLADPRVSAPSENEIYGARTGCWVPESAGLVENAARRHLHEDTLGCRRDLLYLEVAIASWPSGLLADGKRGKLQIGIGLLTFSGGCPVAVEVFKGSTGDPTTVRRKCTRSVLASGAPGRGVGDRGVDGSRIREDLQGVGGCTGSALGRPPAGVW